MRLFRCNMRVCNRHFQRSAKRVVPQLLSAVWDKQGLLIAASVVADCYFVTFEIAGFWHNGVMV